MNTEKRQKVITTGAEAAGAAAAFACAYLTAFVGTDYPAHVRIAMRLDMYDLPGLIREHSEPLWHLSVRVLRYILDCEPAFAGALVSGVLMAAAFLAACRCLKRALPELPGWQSVLLCLAFSLVSAIYVPFFNRFPYLGQGTPNVWHNPTQIAVRPFMVLFFTMTYEEIAKVKESGFERNIPLKSGLLMAFVLVLTNLSKPSFVMVYFPGIFFMMSAWLIRYRLKNVKLTVQLAAVCIPSAALMLAQYLFIFVSEEGKGGGVAIIPFKVAGAYTPSITVSLLLLLAFPLYMLAVTIRRRAADAGNELSCCMLLAGLLERFLLAETGTRMYHGNFGWGYQASVTLFYLTAVRDYGKQFIGSGKKKGPAFIGASVLLALHLLSGIYYLYYMIVLGHKL